MWLELTLLKGGVMQLSHGEEESAEAAVVQGGRKKTNKAALVCRRS